MPTTTIKKINIIKAASFKEYTQIFDFEKINVFFGYNGCGKTTLSRVVSCLEKKDITEELKSEDDNLPSFSIEADDEIFTEKNLTNSLKIKVFNQDYVSKNINYDNLTGVLVAGEESKSKQDKITELSKKKDNLDNQLKDQQKIGETLKKKIENLHLKIENQKSDVAQFIKNNLHGFDTSYNKTKLENFKNSTEFQNCKILNIDLLKEIQNYNWTNKSNIDILSPFQQVTEIEIERINNILKSSVLDSIKISEITAEFEKWTIDGLELHKNKNQCVFCGSPLTDERKKTLNSHFSDEYKNLISKVNNQIESIKKLKISKIETYFDWYEELREEGENQKKLLNDKIEEHNKHIDKIIATLEKKKENAFNIEFHLEYKNHSLDVSILNNQIEKHREKYLNFEKSKEESANKIITFKIVELEKSTDFIDKQTEIKIKTNELETLNKTIDKIKEEISKTQAEINNLSNEIHELYIGAEKFNQYLDELLPSIGLKVGTNGNNFSLKRNNFQVKNLSEGERNVLSFVYFILSFSNGKDKKNDLKDDLTDWIVFIDDPISSLDDSNLHLIAGFIKNHFKHTKQLFITTHNFNFWKCFRNREKDNGYNHYLIEKKKDSSIISKLEKNHVLVKHQSDYTFVYSKLNEFIKDPTSEDNVTVLNHLRKFLEHFSSFMYPNGAGVDKILESLFHDEYKLSSDIESYIVYNLSNEGSHMQTRTDFIAKNPNDICKNIEKVLDAIKTKYPEHIESLEENN